MRKTTKVSKKTVHSINKKASSNKMQDDVAVPVIKSEPAYININEHSAEIAAKSRLLWLIVGVFTIVLAIFWLIMLRININKQTSDIGFDQIGKQITDSLARFDTEIKDRSVAKPITAEDMAAIKNGLEDSIKSNPDSSLWPTHEFPGLKISLQYPSGWEKSIFNNEGISNGIMISDSNNNQGSIIINSNSNTNKYDLQTWLEKNKIVNGGFINSGFTSMKQIIAGTTSSPEKLIFDKTSSTSDSLSRIIYINSTSTKKVYSIELEASGDISYYKPIMEEIVRTIKILK